MPHDTSVADWAVHFLCAHVFLHPISWHHGDEHAAYVLWNDRVDTRVFLYTMQLHLVKQKKIFWAAYFNSGSIKGQKLKILWDFYSLGVFLGFWESFEKVEHLIKSRVSMWEARSWQCVWMLQGTVLQLWVHQPIP